MLLTKFLYIVKNFVEVHFTEDSAGGLDTLLKLYQFGVISFERFSSCALRIAGMDQDNSSPQGTYTKAFYVY